MGCIFSLLSFVLYIATSLLGTYGAIKLAETDQIKACLDFNDAFNCIKANISTFIIVELLSIAAGLIQSAGLLICFIGAIFTAPYGIAIIGNLVGQLWDNLKPYDTQRKTVRGSAQTATAEIIEEAPFTKVQDIENATGDVQEDSAGFIDKLRDTAEETVEEVTNESENIAENLQNSAEAASFEAQETVEDLTKDVQNAAETAAGEIRDSAENIAENLQNNVETASFGVLKAVKDLTKNVQNAAENVSEAIQDTAENISEEASAPIQDSDPAAETPAETNEGSEPIPPFE
jgi:gas vesicle protein